MGAQASLLIDGMDNARAQGLIARVRAEIARLENVFNLTVADSAICRLNRGGMLAAPPLDLVGLLGTLNAVYAATDGAFDATIQSVWQLMARTGGFPDAKRLTQAQALVGRRNVNVSADAITFAKEGMALTLNGIAQGYVTDRVSALLRGEGLTHVLVSLGEIAAIGPRADGAPWRVGLAERSDGRPEETIALRDRAVATTAPLGTVFGPRIRSGHLIDPHGAGPAERYRRITVSHPSATLADGLSTGFALIRPNAMSAAATSIRSIGVVAMHASDERTSLGELERS
ncbi:MAG: FAD:protein FMN transferase [Pseudomonadota bacterium]